MKTLLALFALLFIAAIPSQAAPRRKTAPRQAQSATKAAEAQSKIDPVKEKNIRRLLELTGSTNLALQAMSNMEQAIRPTLMNAFPPGEYREKLIDMFLAKFHSKLDSSVIADMAVPIYDKYFSDEEIKGLIEFYATPLGKKMLEALPKLTTELQAQGQALGQRVGRESMEEVLAEHPEFEKAIEDAQKSKPSE